MAETPSGVTAGRKSGFLERVLSSPGRFAGICVIGALPYLSGCIGSMMGNTSMMAAQSTSNPIEKWGHMNSASFFYDADRREAERQAELKRKWEEERERERGAGSQENEVREERVQIADWLFACNGYKDNNGDGRINLPEYFGRKTRFDSNEEIYIVAYSALENAKVKVSFMTNNKEVLFSWEEQMKKGQILNCPIRKGLPSGYYWAKLDYDGKTLIECELKIQNKNR